MVDFTLNNISGGSVTYQGVTITSGNSYTVSSNRTNFATDGFLLVDLAAGAITCTINGKTLMGPAAVQLLIQLTLISFSGIIGGTLSERAIVLGAKDGSSNIQSLLMDTNSNLLSSDQVTYNSSLPTLSDTNQVATQSNQFGEIATQFRNRYSHLTGNATTTVKSGSGRLHGIMINRNWTGGTITVYDNTAGSGTKIAAIDVGTPSGGLLSTTGTPGPVNLGPLGLEFSTGLTIVTSGSSSNDITVLYQ